MFVKLICGALLGIDAYEVSLEVEYIKNSMEGINIVGLPENAVKEARDRVQAAIRNANYKFPYGRFTVNLAPADKKKNGTLYDVPLAVGILAASKLIEYTDENFFMLGELSLNGDLRPVNGIIAYALLAKKLSCQAFICPKENAHEAAAIPGLNVYGVENLTQLIAFLTKKITLEPTKFVANMQGFTSFDLDFNEVKGQESAKRAIEIAAAGNHNILFIGPPGSGKTMLAKRIPTILTPLSFDEALEVTKIYSISGKLEKSKLITTRQFRAPHHTISEVALVGGGTNPKPGEISLAHRGVLFLDELPEYKKTALEALRQPLEDGVVTISRANQSLTYPTNCMLVAAMNPCPCGYYGDNKHKCVCSVKQVKQYRSRLSGPLIDRIDLHVEVPHVPFEDLSAKINENNNSKSIRNRVVKAIDIQNIRYKNAKYKNNSDLSGKLLQKHCELGIEETSFLKQAVEELSLSARSYTRILRISRTIADLEEAENIKLEHIAEAISFRCLDRKL